MWVSIYCLLIQNSDYGIIIITRSTWLSLQHTISLANLSRTKLLQTLFEWVTFFVIFFSKKSKSITFLPPNLDCQAYCAITCFNFNHDFLVIKCGSLQLGVSIISKEVTVIGRIQVPTLHFKVLHMHFSNSNKKEKQGKMMIRERLMAVKCTSNEWKGMNGTTDTDYCNQ